MTFLCNCWPFKYLLGKMSINVLPFLIGLFEFFWPLSYIRSLYILHINILTDVRFAHIFFDFVGCLFILLIASFAVQRLLVDVVVLIYLCFFTCAVGVIAIKPLPRSMSRRFFSLCFILGVS